MSNNPTDTQAQVTKLATQKLPTSSVYRIGLSMSRTATFWQDSKLMVAKRNLNGAKPQVTEVDGYHLHVLYEKPHKDTSPKANQLFVYLENPEDLRVLSSSDTYSIPKKNNPLVLKIIQDINMGKSLSEKQKEEIFSLLNSPTVSPLNAGVTAYNKFTKNTDNPQKITSTKNELLKAMDEHIQDIYRKLRLGRINPEIAKHKIAVTKALITFVENPVDKKSQKTEDHAWMDVRHTMALNPKWAFSWSGLSQTDEFLNTVRLLYSKETTSGGIDAHYDLQFDSAKNAWEQFFFHFGFLNYITAMPEALTSILSHLINGLRTILIESALSDINDKVQSSEQDHEVKRAVNDAILILYGYLNELTDEKIKSFGLNATAEDIRNAIENFDEYLDKIAPNSNNHFRQEVRNKLSMYHEKIKRIVGEPYPVNYIPNKQP